MKGWFTIEEASEYCGVSKRTMRNWIKTHGLKYAKVQNTVRISIRSLDEFLESHVVSNSVQDEAYEILSKLQ